MLATFMEVLDTSVANVALPHIAGNLSASTEESTWVLTSYLVSNAIILPATNWLGRYFGRKRFLIICIIIFTASSALCGAAASLGMLIVARILQGAGGGALQPIAQAVLMESFPTEKRGSAMAVFGMGVVVAPIIGPTLGGWITDNYSWRWIFYINIPIGILAVFMANMFIEDPPYIRNQRPGRIDRLGFALMAIGLGTLQLVLDKGQEEDWFASSLITAGTIFTVVTLVAFVIWELSSKEPIVDLRVLKNRNFAVGTSLMTVLGVVLYGTIALLPLFWCLWLSSIAEWDGGSPRFWLHRLDDSGRSLIRNRRTVSGDVCFLVLSYATLMFSDISLTIVEQYCLPGIVSGFAMGFIRSITTMAMGTLPKTIIRACSIDAYGRQSGYCSHDDNACPRRSNSPGALVKTNPYNRYCRRLQD